MMRAHVRITGRVQGVTYREATRAQAERHDVHGWVRNRRDGSVEALFVGEDAAVDRVLDWCHQGPPAAEVGAIEHLEGIDTGPMTGFEVRETA